MDADSGFGEPKSTKNPRKSGVGRLWALGSASGMRRDVLGSGPGVPGSGPRDPKAGPGTILGPPGRAKSGREPPNSLPEPAPRRSRTTPKRCSSAFGAPGCGERARRTIFRRFCMVVRKLRCAEIIAPANVLYTSNEVSTDRARTSKKLENQGVSASKIEAGSGRTTQNQARAAQVEQKNGLFERTSAFEVPPGPPKIEK